MARLRLRGPLLDWSDTALAATLEGDGDEREVMVFLGPDGSGEHPNPVDRDVAAPWIGREGPGVLTLLDVLPAGTRNGWVHPRVEAVGLGHLVDARDVDRAPIRVAAEIVAQLAESLHGLGHHAADHPGPLPEDVGLDAQGRLHVVGFASPWPRAPVSLDPAGGDPQEALVWRLGVLLAQLLGGRVSAVHDHNGHEAMVRRVLIRAMSRGGPMFSERYRDWLTGLLAWESRQRPALSAVAPGLRQVAEGIDGPDLPTWAAEAVPAIRARVAERMDAFDGSDDTDVSFTPWTAEGDPTEDVSIQAMLGADLTAMGTLPGVPLSALERDDETAESTLLAGDAPVGTPRIEPGTMPVGVGPPAAVMRKSRPSLPQGFLEDVTSPATPVPADDTTTALIQLVLLTLLVAVTVGLLGLVGLVLWFGWTPY